MSSSGDLFLNPDVRGVAPPQFFFSSCLEFNALLHDQWWQEVKIPQPLSPYNDNYTETTHYDWYYLIKLTTLTKMNCTIFNHI